ncbi:MAG: D-2-hydroxyacid dehydrogenase [Bryobacteraceae bacterium]|jgi:phosphoglycerate dehydrogenase-like enzyme
MSALTLLVTGDAAAPYLKALDRLPSETRITVSNDRERLIAAAPEADVILNAETRDPTLLTDAFPHAKRVRWVHTLWAGVDKSLSPEIIQSPAPFTNGRGVFAIPLGEWAISAMLHFSYQHRRLIRDQEEERWAAFDTDGLYGKTLGIVGYGEIGKAIAERAKPFGMRIIALRRRPELSAGDPLLDASYPNAKINQMMSESDFVALAAPVTPETRGMVGKEQIAAMKPSAVIINVGRGPVLDETSVIEALEAGKIRGAGLDVFTTEPLPAGHPFYRLKNVLLSPHCADRTPGWQDRAVDCFLENFSRFQKGEPLNNVVDKHAGY